MDYSNAIGVEFRGVESTTHKGQPARIVIGERYYPTGIEDLWDAITNPERLPRWFLPIGGDLKVGGTYQLEGNAGGTVERCDPPEALDLTWEFGGNISWVRVRLSATDGGAILRLEHISGKDKASEAFWKQYGPGAAGVGWELSFMALGLHLKSQGDQVNSDEYDFWIHSDSGKDFVQASAKAWGDAHIASGEEEGVAREMAEETAKFYTGE